MKACTLNKAPHLAVSHHDSASWPPKYLNTGLLGVPVSKQVFGGLGKGNLGTLSGDHAPRPKALRTLTPSPQIGAQKTT